MSEKRYSILRVDNKCPIHFIDDQDYCTRFKHTCEICMNLHGDTKEQFISKIETGLELAINEYEKGKITGNKNRRCAEIVAEYLGVK